MKQSNFVRLVRQYGKLAGRFRRSYVPLVMALQQRYVDGVASGDASVDDVRAAVTWSTGVIQREYIPHDRTGSLPNGWQEPLL